MLLIVKRLFLFIGLIITSPLILFSYLESLILGRKTERIFNSCKELVASVPTHLGNILRLSFYWATCTRISPDALFSYGSMIAHRDTTVGKGTVIGSQSIIGYADIGEHVLIGSRVSVISGKYQHGKPSERIHSENTNGVFTRIKIGDSSWIGEGAIILANIGTNCTVAAGSVVLKDVGDNTTVMGNPARKVSLN